MNGPPRVSVCLITYRQQHYIEQAVRSILAQQTSFPIEIVVGEDASPDRTPAILQSLNREFPGRLTLLLRESNLGMHGNVRDTYDRCRGEFVAFLEGDDYWTDPQKLQQQVDALDQHAEWSGCFHPAEYVDRYGAPLGRRHPAVLRDLVTFDDLCQQNWIQTCSLMIRKSAVPQIPGWLEQLAIADWAICLLATTNGPLGMLPECMAGYRLHPGGVWTRQSQFSRIQGFLRAYTTIAEQLPSEFTLQLMKGQQSFAQQILELRLVRLLVGLHEKWQSRRKIFVRYRRGKHPKEPTEFKK